MVYTQEQMQKEILEFEEKYPDTRYIWEGKRIPKDKKFN